MSDGPIHTHTGLFGDFSIQGTLRKSETGEAYRQISASEAGGNGLMHHYYVAGGEFFSLGFTAYPPLMVRGVAATDIDPDEKEKILRAIAEWEELDRKAVLEG